MTSPERPAESPQAPPRPSVDGRGPGARTAPSPGKAFVVGTGLIGASLGLALRSRGWHVTGADRNPARAQHALELGALDAVGEAEGAHIAFVATPVRSVPQQARAALAAGAIVTDVGSVKAPVAAAVRDPRFVGGHPMAGSEQEGVEGADGSLFEGATWVLTPTVDTDPDVYAEVRSVITSLGADVVALSPESHDALVAQVSHVPHLVAATLMRLAAARAEEHVSLLRLAAGGFRDMTRVAAGHPGIWIDVCLENQAAIVDALDGLIAGLSATRDAVAGRDRKALIETLERARVARRNLPARMARAEDLCEVRVPVPDRPGVVAEVTTLAGELGVNIEDFEIAHSAEGPSGVLILVAEAAGAERVRAGLVALGYHPSVHPLA